METHLALPDTNKCFQCHFQEGWGSDGSLMEPEGRVNSIHATGPTGGLILKGQLACTCGSKLGMDIGQAKQ